MLISLQWLSELLGGIPLEPSQTADHLTQLGLEVEGVHAVGEVLEPVRVAEVRARAPHPQADRLSVVEVFDGEQMLSVVCGAPNVPEPGGKVAFAPVDTTLPGGLKLEAREIRGVRSMGMICSEDELALGPDASGILVLPEDWSPGQSLASRIPGVADTLIELSITPNRPDALGHLGVARDLAVRLRCSLTLPEIIADEGPVDPQLVTLQATERCGRYLGHALEGAVIGPAPLWMRIRLHRLGLRPINSVVDITNYVLMETGQPLHAFDRARLAEGRVVIRRASDGEAMQTLDDRELTLTHDDLVIADASVPRALAGVMGGADSGVQTGTTELLLETAWFQPSGIRRTARRHDIHSDSSHRFERGVDPGEGLHRAATRALALLQAHTGARLVGHQEAVGRRPKPADIRFRPARVRQLLGMDIEPEQSRRILVDLGVAVDSRGPGAETWRCRAPTHRPDLQREEDLVEEVMRHHGLQALPAQAAVPTEAPTPATVDPSEERQRRLVEALQGEGLMEVMPMVFAGERELQPFADEIPLTQAVELANPLRAQASHLRTHMLPGLLECMAVNVARHGRAVGLFEVGSVYRWRQGPAPETTGPTAAIDAVLPEEPKRAAVLLAAGSGAAEVDGRDVAGILLHALERLGYQPRLLAADQPAAYLHPGVQARIGLWSDDKVSCCGRFGEIHPALMRTWDLPEGRRAYYGELWLEQLPAPEPARYRPLPRFPASSRDLSLSIPRGLPAAAAIEALHAAADEQSPTRDGPFLAVGDTGDAPIELIEDYRGEGVEPGQRALLFRLHYRASGRSVTDAEVDELHERIVARACDALRRMAPDTQITRR